MIAALTLALISQQPNPNERRHSLTGNVQVIEKFESKIFGRSRNLWVYLPPNYANDKGRRYKVLYMGDGQNLMDGFTAYIPNKEWKADETAEMLITANLIEPVIIVGIDNAGAERMNEYTPTFAKVDAKNSGGGQLDKFGQMVITEIMPEINKRFRTLTGPENTAIGGSSLGGLMALGLTLNNPNVFGSCLAVSPSFWWDNGYMSRMVDSLKQKPNVRVYVDQGGGEADPVYLNKFVTGPFGCVTALKHKGYKLGDDFVYVYEGFANHSEDAWARRMPLMLLWLYGKKK